MSCLRQEDKEERKAAFLEPHSHWGHGMWVCPSTPLVLITGSLEGDSHTLNLEVRKQGQRVSGWPEITQPLCGMARCQSVCPIPMHLSCIQSSLRCSVVPDKLCTLRKTRSSLCLPNRNLTQNKVSFIASPQNRKSSLRKQVLWP